MRLLQEFTLERSVYDPDFRGPRLIGRENDPPVIRTSDFDPDILIFRDERWQTLTSCRQIASDIFWAPEPSPHGVLLSQIKVGTPYNHTIQCSFLDPMTAAPRFPPFSSLLVWEYLSNGTLLCVEDETQKFVCAALDGTLLWRSSVVRRDSTQVQLDECHIYFQDEKQVQVYNLQGEKAGIFSLPPDLAPQNVWTARLSFPQSHLHIEGLAQGEKRYMAWDYVENSVRSQTIFDLSSLPHIWRMKPRKENVLFVSSLPDSRHGKEGTQCCLFQKAAPAAPFPLFSYWEREFSGAELFWLNDETFALLQFGHSRSSFYVYSIQGECLAGKTDLPGFLWMDACFFSHGLLYFQTRSSQEPGSKLFYHFSVYQL